MRHPAPAAEQTAPPSFQALLINTLTLMTGYAQTPAGTFHRSLLAGQVAQQLGELAARPRISPAMRALFMRRACNESHGSGGSTYERTLVRFPLSRLRSGP